MRAQRLGTTPGRPAQRQAAQRGLRRAGPRLAAAYARTTRGRRRLDARLATAATTVVVIPAAVELSLLPGFVLRAHDAEDEDEQTDQRDLEPQEQPEEPEIVAHVTRRVPRALSAREAIPCDMLAR